EDTERRSRDAGRLAGDERGGAAVAPHVLRLPRRFRYPDAAGRADAVREPAARRLPRRFQAGDRAAPDEAAPATQRAGPRLAAFARAAQADAREERRDHA